MQSLYEEAMKLFDWVEFEEGRAKFDGVVRGCDEKGHHTFAAQLPGRDLHYGEFNFLSEADKIHYNIVVLQFGFDDRNNVDNNHPNARAIFNPEEAASLERVISALMVSDIKKPFPIHDSGHFLGKVFFREGWLKVRPR